MKITCIWLEKTKDLWLRQGIEEYLERLKPFCEVVIKELRAGRKKVSSTLCKEDEGKSIIAALPEKAFVVACDLHGKQFTSEALAHLFEKIENQGQREVAFVIGGAFGLSEMVIQKASLVLSLSVMTFTHDMARLILVEQIYRAFTIKKGIPYHY